jgi:hypothetical protein
MITFVFQGSWTGHSDKLGHIVVQNICCLDPTGVDDAVRGVYDGALLLL